MEGDVGGLGVWFCCMKKRGRVCRDCKRREEVKVFGGRCADWQISQTEISNCHWKPHQVNAYGMKMEIKYIFSSCLDRAVNIKHFIINECTSQHTVHKSILLSPSVCFLLPLVCLLFHSPCIYPRVCVCVCVYRFPSRPCTLNVPRSDPLTLTASPLGPNWLEWDKQKQKQRVEMNPLGWGIPPDTGAVSSNLQAAATGLGKLWPQTMTII